ncbi:hypothetical protein Ahy_B04g071065 isoform B [Arachis hypogaea]|uniref:Uncharacterized protein n=1 Tax=Arachis hypogaea TaxID=3818 RepID=A0A444ZJZ0_ARAHY|nr:hypothetical protein Ahy_B04g071065 isoform B [Arachis hypogaea]
MEPRQRRHGSDWGLAVKATAVKTHRQRNAMKEIDDTGERRRSDDEMATVREEVRWGWEIRVREGEGRIRVGEGGECIQEGEGEGKGEGEVHWKGRKEVGWGRGVAMSSKCSSHVSTVLAGDVLRRTRGFPLSEKEKKVTNPSFHCCRRSSHRRRPAVLRQLLFFARHQLLCLVQFRRPFHRQVQLRRPSCARRCRQLLHVTLLLPLLPTLLVRRPPKSLYAECFHYSLPIGDCILFHFFFSNMLCSPHRRFVQLGVVRIGTRGDSNCSRLTSGYAPFRSKLLPFVDDYCFRKLGSCCCINKERTEETTFPFFPLRFPMVDPSRTIDVEKLISWCDDLVKILPDQHDIDNLALCLQRTTSLSSTCNSDLNHVRNLLQDCQKKIDACKQKKEEARCESASDAELDLLQRELDEELEKENFLKEEFR